jgi:hypothetical protein
MSPHPGSPFCSLSMNILKYEPAFSFIPDFLPSPQVKHPFNAQHEADRKRAVHELLSRTPAQTAEDNAVGTRSPFTLGFTTSLSFLLLVLFRGWMGVVVGVVGVGVVKCGGTIELQRF